MSISKGTHSFSQVISKAKKIQVLELCNAQSEPVGKLLLLESRYLGNMGPWKLNALSSLK